MSDRIPDEIPKSIMLEACVMAHRLMLPDEDVFNLAVDLVSRALMARDQRAAAIVRRLLVFADTTSAADKEIPAAILSYDEAQQ